MARPDPAVASTERASANGAAHPTPTVIPAKAGIRPQPSRDVLLPPSHPRPSFLRRQESILGRHPTLSPLHPPGPHRHPCEGRNPSPSNHSGRSLAQNPRHGDDTQDAEKLKDALTIARQFPGPSALFLEIEERSRITHLEVPASKWSIPPDSSSSSPPASVMAQSPWPGLDPERSPENEMGPRSHRPRPNNRRNVGRPPLLQRHSISPPTPATPVPFSASPSDPAASSSRSTCSKRPSPPLKVKR